MASKYSVDVTSSAEPASADYSALARAADARGKKTEILAGAAQSLVGVYQKTSLAETEKAAADLAATFLRDNMLAQKSAGEANAMDAARPRAGGAVAEAMLGARGPEGQVQAVGAMKGFEKELTRLKDASTGGMSNADYVLRVETLTSQAIASNPGMADEIRRAVAANTGIAGADRYAAQAYVEQRFAKSTTGKDPLSEGDMAAAAIKRVAPLGTFGDELTLTNLYQTNRTLFDTRMKTANEYLAGLTQTKAIQDQVAGLQASGDLQADQHRGSMVAIFAGQVSNNVLSTTVLDKENVFGQTLDLMSKGVPNIIDPTKFKVLVDLHNTQMRTNIEGAKRTAYQQIDTYLTNNPNITDAKRKEMYADVDRSAENLMGKYADKEGVGLGAMANIMSTYRDKTLTEKQQLVDLALKQQSAMQNNPMVMAYWSGGANRENLKRTNPHFYDFMVGQEQNLMSNVMGVRDDVQAAQGLATIQQVHLTGEATGEAVEAPIGSDQKVVKAGIDSLTATAVSLLDNVDLQPNQLNVISSAFSTSAKYGSQSQLLVSNYKTFGKKLQNLSPTDLAVVKSSVSRGASAGVESIRQIRDVINAKYNTNYSVGVSPEGILYMDSRSTAVSVRDPKATAIAEEFRKQTKAVAITTVYGRAMLTNEEPMAIGQAYADAINNGTQVLPFYDPTGRTDNIIPKGTQPMPEETPTTSQQDLQKIVDRNDAMNNKAPEDMDAKVRAAINSMKEFDPNLNVDFVYNAYVTSDKKKKEALFKSLTG